MKVTDFKIRIKALNLMSRGQRDTLRKQLQGKEISDAGVKLIEQSLTAIPTCPHCDSGTLYRGGTSCNLQRYRCRDCKRTFNALTHAPLARLRYKDSYEQAVEAAPHNVRFTRDGKLAYVTLQSGAGIGVIDTTKRQMVSFIPVPGIT